MARTPVVQQQKIHFDVPYVARILAEQLSDQYGVEFTFIMTKKTPEELAAMHNGE